MVVPEALAISLPVLLVTVISAMSTRLPLRITGAMQTLAWGPLLSLTGGDRGIRTPDLCDANAALSLLSYIP